MLYKVVIICVAGIGCAPTRLEPQFNAESEEELREKKLPDWLKSVGYTQVEGTAVEVSEVKSDGEPEPEPSKGEAPSSAEPTGPTAPDGTKLPTLDEYVSAGYKAENYEGFIENRMKQQPSTPAPPAASTTSTEPVGGGTQSSGGPPADTSDKSTEPTSDQAPPSKDGEAPAQS